ncbi:hypothetical protein P9X10_00865 [Bacillus cereus]|nr:hypothetical protein [Bacillus cereus]
MSKEYNSKQSRENLRQRLTSETLRRFKTHKTKEMQKQEDKLETDIVLGGLAYMGERGDGIARPKETPTETCTCIEPKREVRLVEGTETYVKDVFCKKCDKLIYL